MPHDAKKYLADMQKAAAYIGEFTAGKTFDEYQSDVLLRSAIERQFTILGEALFQLARQFPEAAKLITDHRAIISFRHVLVHGYDSIRDQLVWGIIENDLSRLEIELKSLLGN